MTRHALLALALFTLVAAPAHAQLLGRASSAARGGGQSSGRGGGSESGSGSGGGSGSSGSAYGSTYGSSRPDTCYGPVFDCIRKAWRDGGLGDVGGLVFPWATVLGAYPYADGAGGYALPSLDDDNETRDARTAFRLELDAGYVLEGAARAGASVRMQLPVFLDLASRYSVYWEPRTGDALAIGRSTLEMRLLDAVGIQIRVGVGLLHFHDALGGLFGAVGAAAVDLFLADPLVITVEASLGVTDHAVLPLVRASAGLMIDATEIYVGYAYEVVEGETDAVDLGGPMAGLRQWL